MTLETVSWQTCEVWYSKNSKDWVIRSQAPKFANDKNMEKVQRVDVSGLEEVSHL